jgi:esterase
MQLHFKEYGSGTPLLILHGLFGASDNWQGIAQRLAERFHVFSVDLRNHGQSPHSAEMNFTAMADDLAEFLATHRLAEAVVMGHSLGGKVAMQFALSHPDLVTSLVVADMAPRAYAPAHETILAAMLVLDLSAFQTRQQIDAALTPAIPEAGTRRFLLKNVGSRPDGTFYWKLNLSGIHENYARLNETVTAVAPFTKATLFIRGGKSDYISDTDWPAIQNLFPAAKLATIAEAGHWVHADSPEKFLSVIREFLKG